MQPVVVDSLDLEQYTYSSYRFFRFKLFKHAVEGQDTLRNSHMIVNSNSWF